jgi:hypothetical protein
VAPLFIAFSALAVPRLLAGHRVSGMAGLDQALHRSVLGFDLSFVVLLVFGVVLANAISYRRSEVVAGLRARG